MAAERARAAPAVLALALFAASGAGAQVPPRAAACAACHGPNGNSQVPTTPSLAGQPRLFLENQLVLIRDGTRDIPEMRGLLAGADDAELVALARYFAEQKPAAPPQQPAPDAARVQRGQQLAERLHCASCHLPDYTGRDQVPRLKDQPEAFLRESMRQFRDRPGLGRDTIMAATLRGLSDQELADLAHFIAQLR